MTIDQLVIALADKAGVALIAIASMWYHHRMVEHLKNVIDRLLEQIEDRSDARRLAEAHHARGDHQ